MVPSQRICGPKYRGDTTIKGFNSVKWGGTRDLWKNELSREFGQLADGFPEKVQKGTNTIHFVARNNIPVGITVTYSNIAVNVRPQK